MSEIRGGDAPILRATYVPLVGLVRRIPDERPSRKAPEARFRNELEGYMSEGNADEPLKAVVSWARYAA